MIGLPARRLYLCTPVRDDLATFIPAVLDNGVDLVQLREKNLPREAQLAPARLIAQLCAERGVPFLVNDDPTLALEVGADGVHVGQEDVSVERCRELLGDSHVVGLSTHTREEFTLALAQRTNYLSAGPIEATPTKPGRPGTGVDFAVESQGRSDRPVFVTGGVTADNIAPLVGAGLRYFVVVRALTESPNPGASARALRRALDEALSAVTI